jgi:hypothetical protein
MSCDLSPWVMHEPWCAGYDMSSCKKKMETEMGAG